MIVLQTCNRQASVGQNLLRLTQLGHITIQQRSTQWAVQHLEFHVRLLAVSLTIIKSYKMTYTLRLEIVCV